jgi:hypothetical protein
MALLIEGKKQIVAEVTKLLLKRFLLLLLTTKV